MVRFKLKYSIEDICCTVGFIVLMLGWYSPALLKESSALHTLLKGLEILGLLGLVFIWGINKISVSKFDIVFTVILILIALSSLFFGNALSINIGRLIYAFYGFAMIKYIAASDCLKQRAMLRGCSYYFTVICTINTIIGLARGMQPDGYIFFVSSDNGSVSAYLLAICFSYAYCFLFDGKKKACFIINFVSGLIFVITMQIGVGLLIYLAGTGYILLYIFRKHYDGKVIDIRFMAVVCLAATFVFLGTMSLTPLQKLVDSVFYGKWESITSRAELWRTFLELESRHWLLGYGWHESVTGVADRYIISGNCHNIFIGCIYHTGILVFLLFWILIFMSGKRAKEDKGETVRFFAVFFIICLLHGLVEDSFLNSLFYLIFIYYAPKIGINITKGEA